MSGVNKVILIGNLGADPEIRHLQNGATVANFRIATTETYRDKQSGEKREQVEWHTLVAWRGLAEVVEKYVRKGSKIYVEGKLRTRKWEKDGIDRYSTEIHVDELTMLDRASDRQDDGGAQRQSASAPRPAATGSSRPAPANVQEEDGSDDLPF